MRIGGRFRSAQKETGKPLMTAYRFPETRSARPLLGGLGSADVFQDEGDVARTGKITEQRHSLQQLKLFFGNAMLREQFLVTAESFKK